jgi:amylosucrase
MIAVRKEIPAFGDFNNRELLEVSNPHIFTFFRVDPNTQLRVLVVGNFDANSQYLNLNEINKLEFRTGQYIKDLHTGESPVMFKDQLVLPPYQFYWLSNA